MSPLVAAGRAAAVALLALALPAPPDHIAPDFTLPSIAGAAVHLADFRGKVVLLNFWATWCAPCRVEMPWLVEAAERFRNEGLIVVGVSMDSGGRAQILDFVTERRVTYPILIGNHDVADSYGGVRFLPQTFFIGRDGRIMRQTFGVTSRDDLLRAIEGVLRKPIVRIDGLSPDRAP